MLAGVVIVAVVLSGSPLWAQFTSVLEGTVTDPTGAVVPNATVSAKDTATGVTRTVQTSGAGNYRIPSLPASVFEVTITAQGFQTAVRPGIVLEGGRATTLNVTLELGAVTTEVTVEGAATLVETSEAKVSQQIGETRVKNLPLMGRNFYSLVVLTPGVTGLPSGAGGGQAYAQAAADIFNTEFGVTMNASGQRGESNSYLVDSGSVNASPRGGVANLTPNSDAVQELRVSVNNFSAEYGRNSSAMVNVVTKSGTNDVHGTLAWFHTNNHLVARNAFQLSTDPNDPSICRGLRRHDGKCDALPVLRRNEFVWSLGGPIRKDKTFFFASMDILRSGVGVSRSHTVLSPEFREFLRNDASTSNSINTFVANTFLPAGVIDTTPTGVVRTVADEANRIALAGACANPGDDLTFNSPNGRSVTMPCDLVLIRRGTFNSTVPRDGRQTNFRVDHHWNEARQRLYANFFHTKRDTVNFAAPHTYPAFDGIQPEYTYYGNLNYTQIINPTMLFETSVTMTRVRGDVGIGRGDIPNINVPGIASYGMGFTGPTFIQSNGEWRNVLSWNRGRHSFKFGGNYAIENGWKSGAQFGQEWTRYFFDFNNLFEFALDDPFAQRNYGINPVTGEQFGPNFLPALPRFGIFINDDWKVRPNLTVSLGLRWEVYGIPREQQKDSGHPHGLFSGIEFRSGNDFFSRIADAAARQKAPLDSTDYNNFAPRIGIAWDPTGSGKMSLRAGAGIFYDRAAGQFFGDCCATLPVHAVVSTNRFDPTGARPNFGLGTLSAPPWGYPAIPGVVAGLDERGGLLAARAGLGLWDPNLRTQYASNWFLGLQYAVSTNWVLEANYVGSVGRKLYQEFDVNRMNGDLLDVQQVGVNNLDQPIYGVRQNRLNPSFGNMGYGQANGSSAYNGANVSARRRYSRGLDFQIAYTVGRAIDTASSFGRGLVFPDVTNLKLNRALADFDIRQKVAASFLYDLPSPNGGTGALGKAFGGWQLGAVMIAQKGRPFSVFCNQPFAPVFDLPETDPNRQVIGNTGCDFNADGFNNDRPHEASFGNHIQGTKETFLSGLFKATDFPRPGIGETGSLGRNTFIGPGYFGTDLNVQKNTKIPWFWGAEGATVQFRGEFYNAFNNVNLTQPDGNLVSGNFGRVTSAFASRNIQFGLKVIF
jgi:hypothetical protein